MECQRVPPDFLENVTKRSAADSLTDAFSLNTADSATQNRPGNSLAICRKYSDLSNQMPEEWGDQHLLTMLISRDVGFAT